MFFLILKLNYENLANEIKKKRLHKKNIHTYTYTHLIKIAELNYYIHF